MGKQTRSQKRAAKRRARYLRLMGTDGLPRIDEHGQYIPREVRAAQARALASQVR